MGDEHFPFIQSEAKRTFLTFNKGIIYMYNESILKDRNSFHKILRMSTEKKIFIKGQSQSKTKNLFVSLFRYSMSTFGYYRVFRHLPKQKKMSKRNRKDLAGVIMTKRQTKILIGWIISRDRIFLNEYSFLCAYAKISNYRLMIEL